ncbi:NlpC/P60 family protein [Methylobacterium sp. sgz302541]|uniref:C40 family peptidase n=1 Tax=unclassified Methylobacterium TaxID=2615210 RepID=UPI003D340B3F
MTADVPLDPRLTPARGGLADIRLRGIVQAETFVEGVPCRVSAPSAPLYRTPSPDSGIDTEAVRGDAATLYAESGGFALVQLLHDGYVGYLPAGSLGEVGPEPTHRVGAIRSFLYPAPDMKRPPTGHLSLGAAVAVLGTDGDFLKLGEGEYVFGPHCRPLSAVEPDWAATAARLVGIPYLWGGRTTLGLDCSGLVQMSVELAGLACPRDTDQQERSLGEALPLDLDLLRRGDLVFWRGHVGMMLDARTLIHANGHHMSVAVEPLAEAAARILAKSYGPVTSLRRITSSLTPSAGA